MPGTADTLLNRRSSEEFGVLKVGVSVDACESRNIRRLLFFPSLMGAFVSK